MALSKEEIKLLRQCYSTPHNLFAWASLAAKKFGIHQFSVDVAASPHNTKCKQYIMEEENGLTKPWHYYGTGPFYAVWCNPPFSLSGEFCDAAHKNALQGVYSVLLTQTATSERWWQRAMDHATGRIDLYPRVNFDQHPTLAEHGIATSSNPGGNTLWFYDPFNIDQPGGARLVRSGPWRTVRKEKK